MLTLRLKVIPSSSKSAFFGTVNGRLKLKVAAAPEDGKANAEVIAFLAKYFCIAKKEVHITAGEKSPLKTISLPANCAARIESLLAEHG